MNKFECVYCKSNDVRIIECLTTKLVAHCDNCNSSFLLSVYGDYINE